MIHCSRLTRVLVLALLAGLIGSGPASAEDAHHYALSLIGKPEYPPDFKHFDYVNPDAPKGGSVRLEAIGGFDSLNPVLYKGEAAEGLGLVYESLMTGSLDEDSTGYGLLAEWASYPPDRSSVTFRLRDNARWQDGTKVTPEDVIYSFDVAKKADPKLGLYYKNVTKAAKTGPDQVTFYFDTKNNRELPMIMGQLTIIPKHYWTGKDAKGNQRDPMKTTLEPPMGSGPYKITKVIPGRSITYTRDPNYWGKDLPLNKGQWNFDQIRFDYYRDPTVAFQAFKAGDLDYHDETSSKNWATGYDFDAVKKGWIKRQEVPIATAQPMQCFAFNLRRPKFDDPRVRRAFDLAFDFQWSNKNLFYGQYKRLDSYFQNTELAAPKALPTGKELEDLDQIKSEVPPEVFTQIYKNPTTDTPGGIRDNLRKAMELLQQAGWQVQNGVLTNTKTGEKMQVEFLLEDSLFERVVEPFIANLNRLGIQATVRLVDSSQYENRLQTFNYDIIVASFPESRSPGNEQRDYWGSEAADRQGSRNLIGIKNKGVDALINDIIYAKDRADLVAATHALDRVLLWHNYVIPQWYTPVDRIAYWDRYDEPKRLPKLDPGFLQVWWYDAAKAAKLPSGSG
jgi:microcin C transport system substrate-binding protein